MLGASKVPLALCRDGGVLCRLHAWRLGRLVCRRKGAIRLGQKEKGQSACWCVRPEALGFARPHGFGLSVYWWATLVRPAGLDLGHVGLILDKIRPWA